MSYQEAPVEARLRLIPASCRGAMVVDEWPPNEHDDEDEWPVPDGPPTIAREEQFAALVGDTGEAGQRRDLFEEPYGTRASGFRAR